MKTEAQKNVEAELKALRKGKKYFVSFDCTHCGKGHYVKNKKELLSFITNELNKPNFMGFSCDRGTGKAGCVHKFDEKIIVIKPVEDVEKRKELNL